MNATQQQIYDILQSTFYPEKLIIIDDSDEHIGHAGAEGGKGHFTIKIASHFFMNKSGLECHRLVYQALHELMQTKIHALQLVIIS